LSAAAWIDKASISCLTAYVAYDAYSQGRTAIAIVAAVFFVAGIIIELTGGREPTR
jgi:hypothetical protein